jgi:hypothetical protein
MKRFQERIWNGKDGAGKYDAFVATLSSSLPNGIRVYVMGSAATGRNFRSGRQFNERSDLDLVLVGPDAPMLFGRTCFRHLAQTTFPFPKECSKGASDVLKDLHSRLADQVGGREVTLVSMTPFYRWVLECVNGPMLPIVGDEPQVPLG